VEVLVYHGPWDLRVESRPDPTPGEGEVLIRVVATGICGSDVHGFTGENGRRSPGQVMGHETVGRVERLGPGVSSPDALRPGTPVTVNPVISCGSCPACAAGSEQSCERRRVIGVSPDILSAFAELLVAPERNVVRLPADMPIEHGALVEPLAVGFHAVRRAGGAASDSVLVIGGGPIGQACVIAAQRAGAGATAVSEPNPARRRAAAALGAVPVDPGEETLAEQVRAALGGPASLVVDAVGSTASLASAMACSRFGARIVLVGMSSPRVELAAYAVSTEERTVIGSFSYSDRDFRETAEWVGIGPHGLGRLIDERVDLAGAPDAFARLGRGDTGASKILVTPSGSAGG
jgi:threonine dehydrogenase-like Zn-dependent dehydrogenase